MTSFKNILAIVIYKNFTLAVSSNRMTKAEANMYFTKAQMIHKNLFLYRFILESQINFMSQVITGMYCSFSWFCKHAWHHYSSTSKELGKLLNAGSKFTVNALYLVTNECRQGCPTKSHRTKETTIGFFIDLVITVSTPCSTSFKPPARRDVFIIPWRYARYLRVILLSTPRSLSIRAKLIA